MGSNVKIIGISQIAFVLLTISMLGSLSIAVWNLHTQSASLTENLQNRITKLQDIVDSEANPNPHSSDEATVVDTLKRLTRQSGFYQSDNDLLAAALEDLIEKKLKPGPKGDKGDQGKEGPQGMNGEPGIKGDTGNRGYDGPKGEVGPIGPIGPSGPMGPRGFKGDIGEQGTCTCPTVLPMTTTQPPTGPSERCGGPGWRKVESLDMTDTSQNCPQGLTLTGYSKRSCGRTNTNRADCSSVTFPVGGGQYSRVCGRAKAYQWGDMSTFYGYHEYSRGINAQYADGLSFTHGTPRKHIWTFAAAYYQGVDGLKFLRCPCNGGNNSPSFVGNDYFCESGASSFSAIVAKKIYTDDPLWDGQGCVPGNPCCSLNNPPWFNKTLPTPTTDDIEMRMCMMDSARYANIALEQLELYVY